MPLPTLELRFLQILIHLSAPDHKTMSDKYDFRPSRVQLLNILG
jgi:hypothetical protein